MKLTPLLLADPSPCLRLLVLRELLGLTDDHPEVKELEQLRNEDPLIRDLNELQAPDGSWSSKDLLDSSYTDNIRPTSMALFRFGYLGFNSDHPSVVKGVEYLFSLQHEDGSWPIPTGKPQKVDGGYDMIPLQTAFPLRAIASCGYASDSRLERGYEWLLQQRLEDGAWPAGTRAGTRGFIAGYRKLAHSQWGCRTNTTAALTALAHHPKRRRSKAARRALDLLLARETKERHVLGFEIARIIGVEPARGYFTHHARYDVAFILNLCWRIGASLDDDRVAELIEFITKNQGLYGLWEYIPHPQVSRWVSFDILRSLLHINETSDWLSYEPRTPFQAYVKRSKRF
ncbi:MAG: prenyltransferase/squalene oxidase repeat-containing protein [Candidatus Hodarchaeota archaeon]